MTKEAMKLALGKIKSARDCHFAAIDTLLFEAEEILEAGLAEQPAPAHPVGVIVSMDVSKGDKPENRIFGRIYEVQEDEQDGVTYLAIEEGRNFAAPQPAQIAGFDVVLDDSMPPNTMKFVQPAQQEPVAWCSQCGRKCPPAQRTWVGLSDAQNTVIWANSQSVDEAIRATEKQLMENNI